MSFSISRAALRAGAILSLSLAGAQAAQAQSILSVVESEWENGDRPEEVDTRISTAAGTLVATTLGGSDVRALTDFGMNKLHARGAGEYRAYAASAWLDSYTVGGVEGSLVDVSFTMTVDGSASGIESDGEYNFKLYALRGNGWSYSGDPNNPADYDVVALNYTRGDGSRAQINARDFGGVVNYNAAGAYASTTLYDAGSDTYTILNANGSRTVLTPTYVQAYSQFGVPGPQQFYANNPNAARARANVVNNYLILGADQFCHDAYNSCGNLVSAGTDVTVSFRMMAGSTFSLAGYLFADDIFDSTVDFFNTARMTGISVSQGGTLNAASGSLVDLGNGQYGYAAALAAVPEPASWALLILGFGLTGAAMRRREGGAHRVLVTATG